MAYKPKNKVAVPEIESKEDYSPWTKQNYEVILKKFYKWIKYGDNYKERTEYPRIVSWITAKMKKKDQPRVQASDILTKLEVPTFFSNVPNFSVQVQKKGRCRE